MQFQFFFKRLVSVVCMAIGAFFLFNIASDIQFGFGVTILALGIFNYQ